MTDLNVFRDQIEAIDRDLVRLLADRLDLCREVGRYKGVHGMPAHLPDRVQLVIARWVDNGADRRIESNFIRQICKHVIAEGTRAQQEEIAQANSAR